MLDDLVRELAQRFGLGASAGPLLNAYLTWVDADVPGHWHGIAAKIQEIGRYRALSSWLRIDEMEVLSEDEMFAILGQEQVQRISEATGVNEVTVVEALAYATPHIFRRISVQGDLPDSVPGWAAGYRMGIKPQPSRPREQSATQPQRRDPRVASPRAQRSTAKRTAIEPEGTEGVAESSVPRRRAANSLARPSWPGTGLLALTATVVLITLFQLRQPGQGVSAAERRQPSSHAQPERQVLAASEERSVPTTGLPPATLNIKMAARGAFTYSGVVRTETERAKIEAILQESGGEGSLDVDLGVQSAPWRHFLADVVRDMPRGLEIQVSGREVTLSGLVASRLSSGVQILRDRLRSDIQVRQFDGESTAEDANASVLERVRELNDQPEVTTDQVLQALNAQVILFRSGSVVIPEQNREMLELAAPLFKRLDPETVIEVGGHSDASGSAAGNQRLSERRAIEVRNTLIRAGAPGSMLVARGYGSTQPKTSDTSEAGQFMNRRIEFRTVSGPDAGS